MKEHVWSLRTCPTTILLSVISECANECCIERPNEKEVLPSYEIADMYAAQGVDLAGGGSPQEKWNDTVWKAA